MISSGKPAFLPDRCDIYVDLRISPRTTTADAARQFEHGKFILRHSRETVGCQLDDP